ncbi:MAG: glycosyltransferase [Candidatus Margulisbacteria bacterium]|jgi:rhamnosyl/mannosyltransferase|nr:glycosyltransferase [Candidatus Margulisiibacteriota bacterium]
MQKKLKILQINKLYYPVIGGVEKVVQQIAEGLKGTTDMKVLVCQPGGQSSLETIHGVEVHKAASLGSFFSMPVSLDFLRQFKILSRDRDILHLHLPFPLADLAVFLFRPKCQIALWWHSDIVRQKKFLLFYKPLLHWLLRRADVIFVATQGHIDGSNYLRAYRKKCRIVPFAVDDSILKKGQNYVKSRQKTGRTKRPVSILSVGRLVYYKGYAVLLEAMARVRGATLDIVGSGPLEKSLRAQARKLGIAQNIRFSGSVGDTELSRAFARCDIFVLPSIAKTEAFGLVQIEAMAYGKPVINTNLPGGVPYVSLHDKTGLTVPPKDIPAMASAIQKLVDDEKLRLKFGKAACKRVRECFTMEQMLNGVMREYRKLANRRI